MSRFALLLFLAVTGIAGRSLAGVQVVHASPSQAHVDIVTVEGGPQPWADVELAFPPFDHTLGTLTDVEVIEHWTANWHFAAENEAPTLPTDYVTWRESFEMNVGYRRLFSSSPYEDQRYCVGPPSPGSFLIAGVHTPLAPFDGVEDYAGPSGFWANEVSYPEVIDLHETRPRYLLWWTMPGPRTIYISPRDCEQDSVTGLNGHEWGFGQDLDLAPNAVVIYHYN